MRSGFQDHLQELAASLSVMCHLARSSMDKATRAVLRAGLVDAETVIVDHHRLVRMNKHAEDGAVTLLALQAPIGRDLRAVISSLLNAAAAERMGGLAVHVAEMVWRRHPKSVLPDAMQEYFRDMGRLAIGMASTAAEVVLSGDAARAAQLRHDDDAMNALHQRVMSALTHPGWGHGVETAVDIALLGRFYERFADHTVDIGRRVVFQATGDLHRSTSD